MEFSSLSQNQRGEGVSTAVPQTLFEALTECGVRRLNPGSREKLAAELQRLKATAQTVHFIWEQTEMVMLPQDKTLNDVANVVGSILSDPVQWQGIVAESGKFEAWCEERKAENAARREPERNSMTPPPKTVDTEEEDRCGYIYSRLVFDRYSLAEVCSEQHLSEEAVKDKARTGCRLSGHDPDSDERLRCALDSEFREQWLKEKRKRMRKGKAKEAKDA